jgi:isopropylmalate/homocitrate/citramalate synthase
LLLCEPIARNYKKKEVEDMVERKYSYTSEYAFEKEVTKEFNLPKKLYFQDCTLREADQVVNLNFDEKVRIAHALDEVGIHQIQVGMPGVNPQDGEAVKRIKKERLNAKLEAISCVYVEDWKADLDACIDSGADSINIIHPSSKIKLDVMGISADKMIDTFVKSIEHAKKRGAKNIAFSPFDATRTDMKTWEKMIPASIKAGTSTIYVCDTYGVMLPSAMRYLVKCVKKMAGNVPVIMHCHNDTGLSLANTLAGIEGGAEGVDATINGIGDRTTNIKAGYS